MPFLTVDQDATPLSLVGPKPQTEAHASELLDRYASQIGGSKSNIGSSALGLSTTGGARSSLGGSATASSIGGILDEPETVQKKIEVELEEEYGPPDPEDIVEIMLAETEYAFIWQSS